MKPLLISSLLTCFLPTATPETWVQELPPEIRTPIVACGACSSPEAAAYFYDLDQGVRADILAALERPENLQQVGPTILAKDPSARDHIIGILERSDGEGRPRNIPLKMLDTHRERWMTSALQAAQQNKEPDHLLEIAAVEDLLLDRFLKAKSAQFTCTDQWKKHAAAVLLTAYATKYGAWQIAYNTAWSAAGATTRQAACAASDVGTSTAWYASMYAITDAVRSTWPTAMEATVRVAKSGGASATSTFAARSVIAASIATSALNPEGIGQMAYRVAETQAWITFLAREWQVFYRVYRTAQAKLGEHFEGDWFHSRDAFDHKIQTYFFEHEQVQDPRVQELLRPLINHLKQIGEQIFADESSHPES
ncbi:MAG: hypothetical protein OXT67_00650 [Zetaproteobacteria bacterium]|nr:hypothetical protein [Zetaproteobacteria bacterium]